MRVKKYKVEYFHTFALYVTAITQQVKSPIKPFKVATQVLTAFMFGDPTIEYLSIPGPSRSQIPAKSLTQPTSDQIDHCPRFISNLTISPRGNTAGSIYFPGTKHFLTIKKSPQVIDYLRKHMIKFRLNNIGATIPTIIEFFVHKIPCHDTVEDIQYIKRMLPPTAPPFQPEQALISAHCNPKCQAVNVLKILYKL
jgi:hypothetical protein